MPFGFGGFGVPFGFPVTFPFANPFAALFFLPIGVVAGAFDRPIAPGFVAFPPGGVI